MIENDFKTIFNTYFDGKLNFADLISLNIEHEIKQLKVGSRQVIKCSEKLKKIHLFLNLFIFENMKVCEDVVFSYRKNVNVVNAIIPHSKRKFIFKTDLSYFFPSIKYSSIYNCISEQIKNIPISDISDYIDVICNLVIYRDKLPLGFSSSPNISNIVFYQYDQKIQTFCKQNNLIYTRYADDILISSDNYLDKNQYIKILNNILKSNEKQTFSINNDKTKLFKKGKKTNIMGVEILPNGSLTVSRKLKNEVETKLYLYSKNIDDFVKFSKIEKNMSIAKLSGQLNYINTIDGEYLTKLKIKYGNSLVELFFRKAI